MAHYAKVLDGKVINVIVAEKEFFDTFVDDTPGEWIQTSYNTRGGIHYQPNTNTPSDDQSKALRKNYAGFGYTYDKDKDAFIAPQPFTSWTLNETTCLWEPPITKPTGHYKWDEELYQSDNMKGWVEITND
jgi:hypothetical protein|tara:strand:- start:181 stop:573 length:393 start_codon:yes stop_codon:yes gene_type:complete